MDFKNLTDKLRSSSKFISDSCSKRISINHGAIETEAIRLVNDQEFLHEYANDCCTIPELHPPRELEPKQLTEWLFLIDLLNFSFFKRPNLSEQYAVYYNKTYHTGYWSLCAAIKRALESNIPITSACFYSKITLEQFNSIFQQKSDRGVIPLKEKRIEILRKTGSTLLEKYDGSFYNFTSNLKTHTVDEFLELLLNDFDSFRDYHIYRNEKVFFLKRAQILIADLWSTFRGQRNTPGEFCDIERVTMFADYRVPQSLLGLGLVTYSDDVLLLLASIEKGTAPMLPENLGPNQSHELEMEIRGCSIYAVELLYRRIKAIAPDLQVNSVLLDYYLWNFAKKPENREKLQKWPIHLCESIFY